MKKETPIITFDELYKDFTLKALNRACCLKAAAKMLGMNERTVYRWKKQYGIVWSREEKRWILKPTNQ